MRMGMFVVNLTFTFVCGVTVLLADSEIPRAINLVGAILNAFAVGIWVTRWVDGRFE